MQANVLVLEYMILDFMYCIL